MKKVRSNEFDKMIYSTYSAFFKMTLFVILFKILVLFVLLKIFVNVPKLEAIEPQCTWKEGKMCGDVCIENFAMCHCGNESFQVDEDQSSVCCAKIGACKKFYENSGIGKD